MKKTLIIALIAIFSAGPVLADGYYRSAPKKSHCKSKDKKCKKCCVVCKTGKVLLWVVKLPVRLVTATSVGVYELVTDQDFSGFEEGYTLI